MDIAKTVHLPTGRYVVAVSGGVDSMALLDILRQKPGVKLTVAHFDHGIRPDSREDRHLIQDVAERYKLPFVYGEGSLGTGASEATARRARYEFLRRIRAQTEAKGIVTAHHMDDALETAIHNLLRGTGRKGLSSLQSRGDIIRPLLHLNKSQLRAYAESNGLKWREDSTNTDLKYRRNYIRHVVLPKLHQSSPAAVEELRRRIRRAHDINRRIDELLTQALHVQNKPNSLERHTFIMLPHNVSAELVAHWLRLNHIDFNQKTVQRLVAGLKTAHPGKRLAIDKHHCFLIGKNVVNLQSAL